MRVRSLTDSGSLSGSTGAWSPATGHVCRRREVDRIAEGASTPWVDPTSLLRRFDLDGGRVDDGRPPAVVPRVHLEPGAPIGDFAVGPVRLLLDRPGPDLTEEPGHRAVGRDLDPRRVDVVPREVAGAVELVGDPPAFFVDRADDDRAVAEVVPSRRVLGEELGRVPVEVAPACGLVQSEDGRFFSFDV